MCCRSEWQERMYIYKWHEVDQTKHEILCSYCLQWNTSQSKFRNHYFLFLFAFSILSQLFLIWGCSCIKFKALKSLKLYKKVLIMISRGLKFGDWKTRIAIWLNVVIKLQKAMISLNKHKRCTFKVRCCVALCTAVTGETVIFLPNAQSAVREWMSIFNKTVVLFRVQTNAKIVPCFYPANTQSFKCELMDQ